MVDKLKEKTRKQELNFEVDEVMQSLELDDNDFEFDNFANDYVEKHSFYNEFE